MRADVLGAAELEAVAEGAAGAVRAVGAGLLPELEDPGLNTRSILGEGLAAEAGERTPGVRLAKDAPPTELCLDTGADGFFGLAAPGRVGASDCRDVRDAVALVGGGAMVCLLIAAEGGAIDVLFAAAAPAPAGVPLILCRAAAALGVGVPCPAAPVILLGLGFAGALPAPFVFGAAGLEGEGAGGCSSTVIAVDGWINRPWFGLQSK